mgnify:FL=1|tara:strand:+ start:311 stop:841 length:531 start_codon:yes stop_codon:yes gene_type:complete
MSKIKLKKNKGIVFWITGLSGSGKTSISKKILPFIKKKFGPTLAFSGDELRNILNFKKYDRKDRLQIGYIYSSLCQNISNQKINLVIDVVGLFDQVRKNNRKKIKNYCEIYIKSSLNKIIKKGKKKIYHNKRNKVWGVNINPEFPKKSHIIINNNFDRPISALTNELKNKILKTIK